MFLILALMELDGSAFAGVDKVQKLQLLWSLKKIEYKDVSMV